MDTSLWMARDLLTVVPDTPLHVASRLMADRKVRHLLVVAHEGSHDLVGIVSSHDLFLAAESGISPFSPRAVDQRSQTVGDIMTRHPCSIPPTTSIAEAARILRERKFGCLPVLDRGELVGILTEHDLLRAFLRMSGGDQSGYEVTCLVREGTDVIARSNALAAARGLRLVSTSTFDHDKKRFALLHFVGQRDDVFVDSLWRSGLTILRVRENDGVGTQALTCR